MRCSWMTLVDFLGLTMFVLLVFLLKHQLSSSHVLQDSPLSYMNGDIFSSSSYRGGQKGTVTFRSIVAASSSDKLDNEHCTMGVCFDLVRCRGLQGFKVYVYPPSPGQQLSTLYENILKVIKDSPYITANPEEACLFVPSFDTLDRDVHSKLFVRGLPPLSTLPFWNGGRNHLLFGQYSGTWPNYSEYLDFPTGKAILARASFNISLYREGFDVSFPLLPQQFPVDSEPALQRDASLDVFPVGRKYLLGFKGKRYLYGQGSEVRSSVHHLHNGREIVMLTTCKHNRDWLKYRDQRCSLDNSLYDSYDYLDLLDNSSFCLIPRGRRLGSFRFLEALQTSCVPVSLSNGYVLPFAEILDWRRSALLVDESQLLQLPYLLRRITPSKVLSLRLHTRFVWNTYFSSVRRIVMTTLQIIRGRIKNLPGFMWNEVPGGLFIHPDFSIYPQLYPQMEATSSVRALPQHSTFTAVISTSRPALRESAPLFKLLKTLATVSSLESVVVLWTGMGAAKLSTIASQVPVTVLRVGNVSELLWPSHVLINTSAVLHITDDAVITADEVTFGFSVWQNFQTRLVGFVGHSHSWDKLRRRWTYASHPRNYVSILTLDAIFYHKYYGYILNNALRPQVKGIADSSRTCLTIVLNFVVAQSTKTSPILLPRATFRQDSSVQADERLACLNMVANSFGQMPLFKTNFRLDPVLYKDDVSIFRKEFRKMEVN